MFLIILYYAIFGGCMYELFWVMESTITFKCLLGATVASCWLSAIQFGEGIEKLQHLFHIKKFLEGEQH